MRTSNSLPFRAASHSSRRGSALLTVLWLAAALSAIGLAVANNVRGETERTETGVDDTKAYFIARGAIERAALHILWQSFRTPDGQPIYFTPGIPELTLEFPGASVRVDVIPEASRLNINQVQPDVLLRLLIALGLTEDKAVELTEAIIDWRTAPDALHPSPFDTFYLGQSPSFLPRHASFQENEELLLVKGMTPELYYGAALASSHAGLRDCVSVYGGTAGIDINTAQPATLEAIGISPEDTATLVKSRANHPILNYKDFSQIVQSLGPVGSKLGFGGQTMFTLRATARLRQPDGKLSDLRRSVEALVKFYFAGNLANRLPGYDIVRWYDRT